MSVDLSTKYLGLKLVNPLVVAACPLTESTDNLRRLEAAGVAAAVLPSLFEEQIEHDEKEISRVYEQGAESFAEALSYFPENGRLPRRAGKPICATSRRRRRRSRFPSSPASTALPGAAGSATPS